MNPYASPASDTADLGDGTRRGARQVRTALARWTLICAISAAPSFFWGCCLHAQPHQIVGMLCGIWLFIVAYTAFECGALYRKVIEWPFARRTALIGYGTRLVISIVFPIGLALDAFSGAFSVGLVEGHLLPSDTPAEASFVGVLLTTLVQGVFLNLILFAYMIVVWSVQSGLAVVWTTGQRKTSTR